MTWFVTDEPPKEAKRRKAGYLDGMSRKAFCTTCSRTVYIDLDDSLVCPVCSSPILEAIDEEHELSGDKAGQSPERK
jgi:rubredoxin